MHSEITNDRQLHSETTPYTYHTGIVYKKTLGHYTVHHPDGQIVICALSNRLRKQLIYPTADPNSLRHVVRDVQKLDVIDPVAIGDEVQFLVASDGSGLIFEVQPRRNRLARQSAKPMPGAHAFEQVIVANVDQVIPVLAAAQPLPKWNLLDRYLASAESLGLPSLVVITKLDLLRRRDLDALIEAIETYRQIGYRVLLTSTASGEGLDELRTALAGRLSVLIGKSGVGKSSLLNAVEPGLGLRVNQVSQATGKGKHTTTHLEMFPLEQGGAIVDTPGMREFGLWNTQADEVAQLFPEMRPFIGRCRFGLDCRHDEEPGCAIRKAVTGGQISPMRYASYTKLRDEA
ncbi:MAG: ribosome small subunit-dependent GTPase A [Chloroflexota bacterium]